LLRDKNMQEVLDRLQASLSSFVSMFEVAARRRFVFKEGPRLSREGAQRLQEAADALRRKALAAAALATEFKVSTALQEAAEVAFAADLKSKADLAILSNERFADLVEGAQLLLLTVNGW
jgi:hypothetical protein